MPSFDSLNEKQQEACVALARQILDGAPAPSNGVTLSADADAVTVPASALG